MPGGVCALPPLTPVEAGGAGQEEPECEGAAPERAPLPQAPPGAALRVGGRGEDPHRQHGLHHLHRL